MYEMSIFHKYKYFCHLKLEIALAIPASNDKNYNQFSSSRVNVGPASQTLAQHCINIVASPHVLWDPET